MRFVLIVTIIVAAWMCSEAAQFIIPYEQGMPGHCFYKELGALEKGKVVPYGHCGRATCTDDRAIVVHTCGTISVPCGTTEDLTKPYPDCCPIAKKC